MKTATNKFKDWKNFSENISEKGMVSRIYKELLNNFLNLKMAKELNSTS